MIPPSLPQRLAGWRRAGGRLARWNRRHGLAYLAMVGGGLWLLASGCAGYKLGPTGEVQAGARSLQVNPVVNTTTEPRLGAAVNHALRKEIQRDGTFRLNTQGEGDIIVNTEITRYQRVGIAYDPRDTLTAADYELTMTAKVLVTDRHNGRELLNREVRARTTARIGLDLASAEYQVLPLLADDLAHRITGLLVDGEW